MSTDTLLDSILSIRRPGKPITEDPALAFQIHDWRESSPDEGEKWLQRSAENGDIYAMEKLGLRLINGDGLARSPDEGLQWLMMSVEQGNLLARSHIDSAGNNGISWLRSAVENGDQFAAITLGTRLIAGKGAESDVQEGECLLRSAADKGNSLAIVRLAAYLLSGRGLPQNRDLGLRWLRMTGATGPAEIARLASYLWVKSLAAPKADAGLLVEEAAVLCQEAIRQGALPAGMILAYLIRRGEIATGLHPSLDDLLAEYLKKDQPFALVNQALRLACGVQCAMDWAAADATFGRIATSEEIYDWWYARSREGDAEGHIVVAWLHRHGLISDPDGLDVCERFALAVRRGWNVPNWISLKRRI